MEPKDYVERSELRFIKVYLDYTLTTVLKEVIVVSELFENDAKACAPGRDIPMTKGVSRNSERWALVWDENVSKFKHWNNIN